jgi:hypothetical protein
MASSSLKATHEKPSRSYFGAIPQRWAASSSVRFGCSLACFTPVEPRSRMTACHHFSPFRPRLVAHASRNLTGRFLREKRPVRSRPTSSRSVRLCMIPIPAIDAQVSDPSCERMKAYLPMLVLLACAGCSDACHNTVASSSLSPKGDLAAVLFQRDCGATTGFSTQISILRPDDKPTGGGNAFIADDDHGVARVGSWEGSWAEARWLAPDHLLIRYAAKSRLFKRSDSVSSVKITYQVVGG